MRRHWGSNSKRRNERARWKAIEMLSRGAKLRGKINKAFVERQMFEWLFILCSAFSLICRSLLLSVSSVLLCSVQVIYATPVFFSLFMEFPSFFSSPFHFSCVCVTRTVSHTTDDLLFQWDPEMPLVVDGNIELPQLALVKNVTADCKQKTVLQASRRQLVFFHFFFFG